MLMEVVGNKYLASQKFHDNHSLESIQLSYMSQGKNTISFQTEIINDYQPDGTTSYNSSRVITNDHNQSSPSSSTTELNIKAIHKANKMIVSQGALRYKRTI